MVMLAERPAQHGLGFGFEEAKSGHELRWRQIGVGSRGQCRWVPPKHHLDYNPRDQTGQRTPVAEHPDALSAMRWELLPEVMCCTVVPPRHPRPMVSSGSIPHD